MCDKLEIKWVHNWVCENELSDWVPIDVLEWISTFKDKYLDYINPSLQNFLRMLTVYEIKTISRNCSNHYFCEKTQEHIERKETSAEHVTSCLKLADFFLLTEEEFFHLSRLEVYDILLYHDDIEILGDDTCISDRKWRQRKDLLETELLPCLASQYPEKMWEKLMKLDNEYRNGQSEEVLFAKAIDKLDSLIHELKYPQDWWPIKNFDERNIREWFQPAFEFSPTFMKYFEDLISFLRKNKYFED